jgi:hypothetical protein
VDGEWAIGNSESLLSGKSFEFDFYRHVIEYGRGITIVCSILSPPDVVWEQWQLYLIYWITVTQEGFIGI